MSSRVFVVCEDHTLDQYVAVPVVKALMSAVGRPKADVRVVSNPRLGGWTQLKSSACSVLQRYGAIGDLVVFVADADCEDGSQGRADRKTIFDNVISKCTYHREKAVVVVARQELEVWALWGHRGSLQESWGAVVAECHPKERFFDALVTDADLRRPGRGRLRITNETLSAGYTSLEQGCPELAALRAEVLERLSSSR